MSRMSEFQKLLAARGLDGYVLTKKVDQGFLTGFFLDGYTLLVGRRGAWAYMAEMLVDQCRQATKLCKPEASNNHADSVLGQAKAQKMKKVGFDSANESYALGTLWKKAGFIECPELTRDSRAVKNGAEAAILRKSCKIAADSLRKIQPSIKPGMTELEVKNMLEFEMKRRGATAPSFDIIVGAGANAAKPHHITGSAKIKKNQALLIDFGCVYGNYCSDITRTIFIGDHPTAEFNKVYNIVARSHKAGIEALKAGLTGHAVDKVCRDIIKEAGYGDKFIHGTGHAVGLEIHEYPRVNEPSQAVLREGMAVTIEPGIYLPGKFGVRIEDTVLITAKGREVLTK